MYQKILVPLDGSLRAERIFPYVRDLVADQPTEIILIKIVPNLIVTEGYKTISYPQTLQATQDAIHESEAYLKQVADKLRKGGLNVTYIALAGPIVETILDVAQKKNIDLIALASHGHSGLKRVFYGSVAAGIIQSIDRPMLVIRARDD